jgi:hypothetical protein
MAIEPAIALWGGDCVTVREGGLPCDRVEQPLIAAAKDGIAGQTKAAQSRAANSTSYP